MCGITGYIGQRDATPVIVDGLKRLEYRGYDSAGVAILNGHGIEVRREEGKLSRLEALLAERPISGPLGIGHTRWATHGPPVQRNAHPHSSPDGEFVVVQNGIVENFLELRQHLRSEGYEFLSDTDTEVIVHLIHHHYHNGSNGDFVHAVRAAAMTIQGPSAIAALCKHEPERLVVARLGNAGAIVIGHGKGRRFWRATCRRSYRIHGRCSSLRTGRLQSSTRVG